MTVVWRVTAVGKREDEVGLFWIKKDGEWAKEANHARNERIDTKFNR